MPEHKRDEAASLLVRQGDKARVFPKSVDRGLEASHQALMPSASAPGGSVCREENHSSGAEVERASESCSPIPAFLGWKDARLETSRDTSEDYTQLALCAVSGRMQLWSGGGDSLVERYSLSRRLKLQIGVQA